MDTRHKHLMPYTSRTHFHAIFCVPPLQPHSYTLSYPLTLLLTHPLIYVGIATVFRTAGSTHQQHRTTHPPSTTTTITTTTTTTTTTKATAAVNSTSTAATNTKSARKNLKDKQGGGTTPGQGLGPGLAPGQGLLTCPQCGTALGYHQRKGLEMCAGFLRVDLYAVEERKITIR